MLSGSFWPAHPHPLPNESLSCWIVRIAHENGLKVQTFCDREFGKDFQVWVRDVDRNAPDWLLNIISSKTGVSIKQATKTTVRLYESKLFSHCHQASQLRWFMPLRKHHRLNKGYALQYCPICLGEDQTPYYRLPWRLAFYTYCPRHRVMMADRCFQCNSPVAFHRIELGHANKLEVDTLDCCWKCGIRLSEMQTLKVDLSPKMVDARWTRLLGSIDRQLYPAGAISYQNLTLLHQLCRLLNSEKYQHQIASYICKKAGYEFIKLQQHKTLVFEQRELSERHYILQLAMWLMTNKNKIRTAVRAGIIRRNWLYKDMGEKLKQEVLHFLSI